MLSQPRPVFVEDSLDADRQFLQGRARGVRGATGRKRSGHGHPIGLHQIACLAFEHQGRRADARRAIRHQPAEVLAWSLDRRRQQPGRPATQQRLETNRKLAPTCVRLLLSDYTPDGRSQTLPPDYRAGLVGLGWEPLLGLLLRSSKYRRAPG